MFQLLSTFLSRANSLMDEVKLNTSPDELLPGGVADGSQDSGHAVPSVGSFYDRAITAGPIGHVDKGAFHRWLGKDEDEPITDADIAKGKASDDPHVVKMATFADNARHWKHK